MKFTIAVINYGTEDLVNRFLDLLADTKTRLTRSSLVLKEVLVVDSGFPEVADAERFVNGVKDYSPAICLVGEHGNRGFEAV
ncbi:hypothetical protein SDD30_05920 [Moorella naiadis]|uniref:hypothetical protein n=1 Tax=Moorella naiadis (nom. illeg.) TaxID=3093670 RepID=UPI003D9CB35B